MGPAVKGNPLKIFGLLLVGSYVVGEFFIPSYHLFNLLNLIGIMGLILCLALFLPFSNFMSNLNHSKKIFLKTNILLIIVVTIFFGRNINRLINENNKYDFDPFTNPVYRITTNHFSAYNSLQQIVNNKFFCDSNVKQCANNTSLDVKKKFGYKIFSRKMIK